MPSADAQSAVLGSMTTFGGPADAHWYATMHDVAGRTVANVEYVLNADQAAALNRKDGTDGFVWRAGCETGRFFTERAAATALIDYADANGYGLLNRDDIISCAGRSR